MPGGSLHVVLGASQQLHIVPLKENDTAGMAHGGGKLGQTTPPSSVPSETIHYTQFTVYDEDRDKTQSKRAGIKC